MAPSNVKFESLAKINNPDLGPLEYYRHVKLAIILGVKYRLLEKVIRPNLNPNIYALSVNTGAVSVFLIKGY
jgi:hypothetical protein